jgi:gluconokinase
MKIPRLRSPHEKLGDIVYFGRMLDKIRLHAEGKLPVDYHKALGGGFDARCCAFLGVKYEDVVVRVRLGGEDADMLEWCLTNGRKPSPDDIEIWNSYLRKRGWRDDASQRLAERKKEFNISHRDDIQTFFDLLDVDEDNEIRTHF